ncbi:hypothetical protein BDQ17DRAFT_1441218 [Cyathus striatus]|nr:hypothetical protein BDQ17DRAFT_1441218 [Cyathus striatus]
MSSVLSNHLAPSHDIALKNAELNGIKHLLSGGYWLDENKMEWSCAGDGVVELLVASPIIQRHLGWSPVSAPQAGSICCHGRKIREGAMITTMDTKAILGNNCTDFLLVLLPNASWYPGVEVIAQSGDRCTIGSWVVVRLDERNNFIGRIVEILSSANALWTSSGIVTMEKYTVGSEHHHHLGMPVLFPPMQTEQTLVVCMSNASLYLILHLRRSAVH